MSILLNQTIDIYQWLTERFMAIALEVWEIEFWVFPVTRAFRVISEKG
jgi:hypothetical protein